MDDLAIYDATLVTPRGRRGAHLYATDGRITAITDERQAARETVDAAGLYLLPGAVDGHVHFQDPGDTSREDFVSGSSAAAVGGVTTVIEHTHSNPVRTPADLHEKVSYLRERSLIDFGLAAHAWPGWSDQVPPLWAAGITFFKIFTSSHSHQRWKLRVLRSRTTSSANAAQRGQVELCIELAWNSRSALRVLSPASSGAR